MVSKVDDVLCSHVESMSGCLSTPGMRNEHIGQKDYDGDACPIQLALDDYMVRKMYPLKQQFNMLGMAEPYVSSSFNSIPAPTIATMAVWLADPN